MTVDLVSILLANVAYGLLGVGLAAALGVFDRRESALVRLLLCPALGIAAIGLVSSYAALAGLAVDPAVVAVLAVVALAAGAWRLRRRARSQDGRARPPRRLALDRALALVPALAIAGVLFSAARTMVVKPLLEWDGWVVWGTKARVLYERPGEATEILAESYYGPPSYPFGLPALEATTMRAIGSFDTVLVDLQILILVAAAIAAIWALLSDVAHPLLIGVALLMPLASPQLVYQLTTNYVDVPLGFLVGLALVSGAVWLLAGERREPWPLACFATFLAFAAWLKNEGLLFALAAVAALIVVTLVERRGRLAALASAAGFAALALPWRIYASVHDLRTYDYDLISFFDVDYLRENSDRLASSAGELLSEMTKVGAWGASVAVIVLGIATALLSSRRLVGLYAAVWLALSFGGLVAIYWISSHSLYVDLENSSFRTIVTLLVAPLCLLPALLQPAVDAAADTAAEWRDRVLSRRRGRRRRPATS
jgi:uncharacterized membrane protein YqjE